MPRAQPDTGPLGIIDSLSAGFGAVAQKPTLLGIPLVLDLFLWLGPRLSIKPIVSKLAVEFGALIGEANKNSAALFEQNLAEILSSYNLFSALSTWPLGVPSLLAGSDLGRGPLGTPSTVRVHTSLELLAWLALLILAGLLLGTIYLSLIARWAKGNQSHLTVWLFQAWQHWLRIVAFAATVIVGAVLLSVPLLMAVEMVAIAFAPLASLVLLTGIGTGMWSLFHLFFATHSILLDGVGVRQAMRNSVAIVSQYRLSSVGLLVIAVIISFGLSAIWSIPPSKSWLRLVAILGNAFVNTGLATATFVYFRERKRR